MIPDFHSSMVTTRLRSWTVRRHRVAGLMFIASYAVAWAYLVGLTDPARWEVLLTIGFGVLFALVLIYEIVATARSLRSNGPQAPLPASVGAGRHAAVRSEERREGKSVDLGGRRIIKKKKEKKTKKPTTTKQKNNNNARRQHPHNT